MAYQATNKKNNKTYNLHSKDVTLRGGRQVTIYFFCEDIRDGALDEVPAGYEVFYSDRTGMPMLRKERKES
ncbi:MAG: hypothetical protein CEN88_310 [Candidatus Berkelbacteria bacterium Licking1014_2]|uniref:Uncharacterized protein n=1 Tax=Candidatus Berkelbacteria bacterium Licking1014_2 TaxID=2017146 RepID=A0A554LVA5_9BACT|nr:MAG: hypothetical protein CEN88_310 [Candidatus Berkelbacteria bacterium Licking1014_2]